MKKYTIFSIILIALLTLFVYMENNSFTAFEVGGINLSLPNAVWLAIFLTLFFIFSLIFFVFINFKNYRYKKNIQKDILNIITNIKNRIFYKESNIPTKILTEINNFTKNINGLNITPNPIEKFEFLEDIKKLLDGEIIEISKYKLNSNNPWFILNIKNRLKKNPEYAKEVLKKFKNEDIKKEAFYIWAKNAPIKEIIKYEYEITFEIIKFHLDENDLPLLLKKANLSPKEEIEIAKAIYSTKTPDEELEILKPLKWGETYLALKYEHLDLAKEIIEENNLKFFEYFLKLKELGQKEDIDEYIESAKIF